MIVNKPWGQYDTLVERLAINNIEDVTLKLLTILPDEAISYQVHKFRDEVWFIKKGIGEITINGVTKKTKEGDIIVIEQDEFHTIHNTGTENLVIFEVQHGQCSEDDIVRISDKYNRIGA